MINERAGMPAQPSDLIDVAELERAYFQKQPNVSVPEQRVRFGTGGHRGKAMDASFNEAHIKAITQAIVDAKYSRSIKNNSVTRRLHGFLACCRRKQRRTFKRQRLASYTALFSEAFKK